LGSKREKDGLKGQKQIENNEKREYCIKKHTKIVAETHAWTSPTLYCCRKYFECNMDMVEWFSQAFQQI